MATDPDSQSTRQVQETPLSLVLSPARVVAPQILAATRRSIHGVAEHLLAAHSRRVGGSIRLHIRDGALSTADLPGEPSRLALRGVVVERFPDGLSVPLTGTFEQVADALGVPFGMPDPPYTPASGCLAQDEVTVDPDAADVVQGAWVVGDRALREFAPEEISVVWPEHLDVAITLDEVNFGVSPGDGYLAEPYAYVGPHTPQTGPFWNAPFGAARTLDALGGPDAAHRAAAVRAFFEQGRALAAG